MAGWTWLPPGRRSPTLEDPLFYLSGPPAMLTAITAQLHGRGVAQEDIRTDAWE